MMVRFLLCLLLLEAAALGSIVGEVRALLARNDFASAETLVQDYKSSRGVTPEMLEAHSWLGRGALAAKQYDKADAYAAQTRKMALELLQKRPLDAEKSLPLALGASIEVQGHALAGRGERSEGVAFLRKELERWRNTSIRTRIQKNIHLLSLEGKKPLPLEMDEYLGPKPAELASFQGKPLLLFFWAHWCSDCKYQAPILARLKQEYGPKGLLILGPTQRYGYAARGQEASPEEELRYIDMVRQQHYAPLADMPVPVSQENFSNYGVSTTPTLALVDRQGVVRLYHPGKMSYEELAPAVAAITR